jgi:hypothetical protein
MGLSIGNRGDKFSITFPLLGSAVDTFVWAAPTACKLVQIQEQHSADANSTQTLNIRKITANSVAPGAAAGSTCIELLATALGLSAAATPAAAANTLVTASLSTVSGARDIAAGNRIAFDFSAAITSYVGAVTMTFQAS